ncbi:MAG: putative tricarboxylic transport rane protein [bacterium]|nr:MAG: Uncharacterized protein XD52_0792 [bacterium 42_11]MDK2872051.1 putative tricarboxylic transport rane protein [bacterium]
MMEVWDLALGILCVLLSAFVFYYSGTFPKFISGDKELPGPSFFPRFVAIFILGFGLFLIVNSGLSLIKKREKIRFLDNLDKKMLLKFIAVLSTGFVVEPVLSLLGAVPGLTAISVFLMRVFRVKWIQSLIYSLALAVFIYWIFRGVFKLPLPEGKLILLFRG